MGRKGADNEASQQAIDVGEQGEVTTSIVDGIPRSSGEKTFRAEVTVPRQGGAGPLGKRGTTSIRGPNRIDKDMVREDIDKLVEAFKSGGSNEIRRVQRELNRSWVKK